jgi:hypothetical protein
MELLGRELSLPTARADREVEIAARRAVSDRIMLSLSQLCDQFQTETEALDPKDDDYPVELRSLVYDCGSLIQRRERASMMLENNTDEQVKVCMYQTDSIFDNAPCEGGVVFLEPFKNAEWFPAPTYLHPTCDVRFFHPELIDKLLARHPNVPREYRVQLSKSGASYSTAMNHR